MTIIEQNPIMDIPDWYALLVICIFATLVIAFGISFIILIIKKGANHINLSVLISFVVIPTMVLVFMCALGPKTETGRYTYKVKLSDEYSINEIYDKYINIQYHGDHIYTFEDKLQ